MEETKKKLKAGDIIRLKDGTLLKLCKTNILKKDSGCGSCDLGKIDCRYCSLVCPPGLIYFKRIPFTQVVLEEYPW